MMRLTSTAFVPGGEIPVRFTCEGGDLSPPLAWTDAPAETRSFSLICSDPDAPGGTFYHWAVHDIAAQTRSLPEGWASHAPKGLQAVNDFGIGGYGGPCPPRGHGRHHYYFTLYALDVASLHLPPKTSCRSVEKGISGHIVATAELIGTFARR